MSEPLRVAILGNSGSGKSTLAQQLVDRYGLASLDLDTVVWVPGKIAVPRAPGEAHSDVAVFCAAADRWVVEGCYAHLIAATFPYQPSLLFLEPGIDVCLDNCRARPWEPHKYASKEEQDGKLVFLLDWVRNYYTRDGDLSLAGHQELFDGYDGPKLKIDGRLELSAIPELPLNVTGAA